jgi:hypothetical protein
MVMSLLEHYERSDGQGQDWYDRAHDFAAGLDPANPDRAAAIVAALSPQVQWSVNQRLAQQVYAHEGEVQEGCLGLSALKAWRLWNGERPEEVLGTRKTLHFYRAIIGDRTATVLDTWMAQAIGWPHNAYSPRQYERAGAALTAAGGYTDLTTADFQAVVWTHIRGGGD